MTIIYHMAAIADWRAAELSGGYAGSGDDLRDGFIHFSTAQQVIESAAKHRKGRDDLLLLFVQAETLGAALRWEPARGGQLFPHLYGVLQPRQAYRVVPLPLSTDGRHVFPDLD